MPRSPSLEENIASVLSGIEEVWNGSWDAAAKYYHPDILVTAPPQAGRLDFDGFRDLHAKLHAAFPDLHIGVDRIFGEGDRVVARWTARGTHGGPFMGCPATGRRFEVMEAAIFRLEEGRAKEAWLMRNGMGQMQQLGLMPKGPPPKALLAVIRVVERLGALMPARRKG
jgi:steroid delta-isomerase-like uncharacterized protein